MADLTPRQIVQELDRYIVGQDAAKKAVAVAIRNRWRRQKLSPELRGLILQLDQFGRFAPTQAVASLYRHLAYWPGFLGVVHAAFSVPHHTGALRAEHGRIRDLARDLASARLLPLAAGPPPPASDRAQSAQSALRTFTDDMIGECAAIAPQRR